MNLNLFNIKAKGTWMGFLSLILSDRNLARHTVKMIFYCNLVI